MSRHVAALLSVLMACSGPLTVKVVDVAAHAGDLQTSTKVTVDAQEKSDTYSWRGTTATIHRDQRVSVWMKRSMMEEDTTLAALLADCPERRFGMNDDATRKAFPKCKLFEIDSFPGITVGTRRYFPWGYASAGLGIAAAGGVVWCAFKCDSPLQEASTGVLIVGGLVATAAIVAIIYVVTNLKD